MSAQDIAPDKLNTDQPFQDSTEALGATLAEARNRMGLEQREVASRLGLNPVLIGHLEKGDFEALGAPIYVRGYLTRYARFLDLPEQQILERHKRLGKNEVPPLRIARPIKPQAKMNDAGVRWFFYLLVFALIGSVGWQGFKQVADNWESSDDLPSIASSTDDSTTIALPQPESETATQANEDQSSEPASAQSQEQASPAAAISTTESASVPAESAATESTTPEATSTVDEPASAAASATDSPTVPDSENPQTAATATPGEQSATPAESPAPQETSTTAASGGSPELVIAFAEDCWVEIKDANGERLAYGIMQADTVSRLTGTPPFSVTLGNSVGVREFTFNGKPVERSVYIPNRGTVSRFSLGTPPANQ